MDESCELMERPSLDYLPLGKSSLLCCARCVWFVLMLQGCNGWRPCCYPAVVAAHVLVVGIVGVVGVAVVVGVVVVIGAGVVGVVGMAGMVSRE